MKDKYGTRIDPTDYVLHNGIVYGVIRTDAGMVSAISIEDQLVSDTRFASAEDISKVIIIAHKDTDYSRLDRFIPNTEVEVVSTETHPELFI